MPATYEPIATYTAGSSFADYTFSSIPSTYTDLVLVIEGISFVAANGVSLRYNGDTGSNYSLTQLGAYGSTTASARRTSQAFININYNGYWTSSTRGSIIVNIENYTNSATYKTCLVRASTASVGIDAIVGLWRNTSAITSLTIGSDGSGNLGATTTMTLYGIKAA